MSTLARVIRQVGGGKASGMVLHIPLHHVLVHPFLCIHSLSDVAPLANGPST